MTAVNEYRVAPFAGAWIEIIKDLTQLALFIKVAPFAGAWIEIGWKEIV